MQENSIQVWPEYLSNFVYFKPDKYRHNTMEFDKYCMVCNTIPMLIKFTSEKSISQQIDCKYYSMVIAMLCCIGLPVNTLKTRVGQNTTL